MIVVRRSTLQQMLPFMAMLFGAACIGASPIFVRLSELGPVAVAFYRVFLAVPLLLAIAVWADKPFKPPANRFGVAMGLVVAAMFFSGDLIFWHASVRYTSVTNATLLANMAVVFVSIGGWILFKQRLSRVFLLGMLLALVGASLLGVDSLSLGWDSLLGDLLGLGAAVCYAGYLLSISWMRGRLDTRRLILFTCIICSLLLLPLMLVFENDWLPTTLYAFVILLSLAWVSQALGQGCIAYGLGYLSAAMSAVSLLVQPIVAGLLAWLIFSEEPSNLQFVGAVIVVVGMVLCRRTSTTRPVV